MSYPLYRTKVLAVNSDDHGNVQLIKRILNVSDEQAATVLMEIGLYSFLAYPTGVKKIDEILAQPKYQEVVNCFKASWGAVPK